MQPIKIAVSGGAGQIAYALLFRLASGHLLGNTPIALNLLEIPEATAALDGVEMELRDCAFPALVGVGKTSDAETAFGDADFIFLVGARPRGPGMERKDLLAANASIFSTQGRAINAAAKKSARILVVGNPANTNCLIAQQNAPDMPPQAFSAMTRLDHNRLIAQLAGRANKPAASVRRPIIWGNHSATQYPDIHHATVDGVAALEVVDEDWYRHTLISDVQQRGAAVIKARGASSAASAASAAIEQMRDWACGQKHADDFVSMAVLSGGEYGVDSGLIYSYPMRCAEGRADIVSGLVSNDFSLEKMRDSEKELFEERDAVRHLLP